MILSPLGIAMVGAIALFGIALYGLLVLHNLIKIVIALQLLVKAAVLALVLGGAASGQLNLGQALALTVIVADTVIAVIGLALAIQIRRRFGTLDVSVLSELRG
jgi:NADH-quinone oxidoreductase subunit K